MRLLLSMLLLVGDSGIPEPTPAPGPQYVVVSFDGAGDVEHLDLWMNVGERVGARFTFFLSGIYLLAGDRAALYQPPHHGAGVSDIGFAIAPAGTDVRRNIADLVGSLNAAADTGHEIASHFNGHFCGRGPEAVGGWGPPDWSREIDAFDNLVVHVAEHNDLPGTRTAFGRVVGARTPCFEGIPALRAAGHRGAWLSLRRQRAGRRRTVPRRWDLGDPDPADGRHRRRLSHARDGLQPLSQPERSAGREGSRGEHVPRAGVRELSGAVLVALQRRA